MGDGETGPIIYNIKKTDFDAEGFPEVVVVEPRICQFCKQPIRDGRCRCIIG